MARRPPRVLALGLDSVPPDLLFDRFLPKMPNVRTLLSRSTFGTLWSTDPPITVPAWAVMFSGMDPGTIGLYGFRHRRPGTYWDTYFPTSRTLLEPRIWDRLSREGKRVCVMGMPPGYPAPPLNGIYISDFMTPQGAPDFASPPAIRDEIQELSGGGYEFDVPFRADDRDRIGAAVFEMTTKHFVMARHLWAKEKWDLFVMHEIGPDRLHHTFWKYFDERHPRYEKNPKFAQLVEDYYVLLDREIGQLLTLVPKEVRVMLLSDHGSQAMAGGFCVNEWLIQKGHLTLRGPRPKAGTPIEKADVDWSKTRAWGSGGYYARIFYNVLGREPEGVLPPDKVGEFEAQLCAELRGIVGPDGTSLNVEPWNPKSKYAHVRGDAPDLMVYFGNVAWRSIGTVGYDSLYVSENDTGPDDAVHSFEGIYSISGTANGAAGVRGPTERGIDVGPTLLKLLGLEVPPEVQGRVIARWSG
jgi:predicted AlkP superfamily phosphohydrolase/phosphomutase